MKLDTQLLRKDSFSAVSEEKSNHIQDFQKSRKRFSDFVFLQESSELVWWVFLDPSCGFNEGKG